jgi:hypothetical protein
MTELTPEAQKVWNAFLDHSEWEVTDSEVLGIAAALRAAIDIVVPEEAEAPKAQFDCEPTPEWRPKGKVGPLHYDHSAHLRRQFRQDKLNIRWEQRQQTRALMLAIITELEVK